MMDIVAAAPLQGFNQSGGAAGFAFVSHRFTSTADGQLAHYSDDQLRAIVPPEGWADYLELWPQARSIVDGLTLAPASAAGIVPAGIEGQERISDQPQDAPQGVGVVPGGDQGGAGR